MATEVVGEIEALKPMASPRPRRIVPLPRSKGAAQFSPAASGSRTRASAAALRPRPVAGGSAQNIRAAERERIDAERARDQVGVALIGPDQLRNAEAAQCASRRPVGIEL